MRRDLIFLDTSFIIAFYNISDKNHIQAQYIMKKSKDITPNPIFIYSDYIFDELITYLKVKKISSEMVEKIGDIILKSLIWKLMKIDEGCFTQTWELIKKYSDKKWSFTDASSFALMENLDITYYLSYDIHFEQYPKIQPWNPN